LLGFHFEAGEGVVGVGDGIADIRHGLGDAEVAGVVCPAASCGFGIGEGEVVVVGVVGGIGVWDWGQVSHFNI